MDDVSTVGWEYKTLRVPRGPTHKESSDPEDDLNELGADGWELSSTVEYVGGGTKFLVFKRPVAEDSRGSDAATELDRTNKSGREGEEESSAENDGTEGDGDDQTDGDQADDETEGDGS